MAVYLIQVEKYKTNFNNCIQHGNHEFCTILLFYISPFVICAIAVVSVLYCFDVNNPKKFFKKVCRIVITSGKQRETIVSYYFQYLFQISN